VFPIILVFILRESVDRNDNPTSRRNMNSRIGSSMQLQKQIWLCSKNNYAKAWKKYAILL